MAHNIIFKAEHPTSSVDELIGDIGATYGAIVFLHGKEYFVKTDPPYHEDHGHISAAYQLQRADPRTGTATLRDVTSIDELQQLEQRMHRQYQHLSLKAGVIPPSH